jgi:outer membrane protein
LTSSAQQQAVAVKNAVQVAVEKAFYGVIAAQKLLQAAKQSLDQFQETYRTTSVLVRTGSRPSFDLTQANVELAKSKLAFINSQNTVDLSKIALLNLMGFSQQIDFLLQEPERTDKTQSGELDLNHLEQKALDFRPEMRSSEENVKDARFRMHAEVTQYLPTLSFQG